ncbi:MAG TPA: asparagine synthase (glutamine-hydrolyzing) [Cyanobacteria bacterium UBA11149]|nr:asparagine synthase (glutamine-hydrolyzing) [Cyanobacteria bacterium UBA11366]HBR77089.1 asparagine synthase (glutamine-hydrolyzing) [Cyanobacteria bacterium UBA11159]HBS69057.1 asparagine synthase (glutamine-hydrolyzing) [Cyanobacteria bacterium UBA11153]HBW88474.1 asparagine synthase (glutamine-hydrolyzing) [Cyanobacteria bacterium UBA11149]HCA94798.1 asparagine synthase (glutamine-hydrolyzing) [Cyanobacteria bacterium UBA9226]
MCGIVGVLNLHEPKPISDRIVPQMLSAIRHRGPDEFGIYRDEWVNLGNARLSIIDLSGGQQPICNEDETLWIVFNGEIFNYVELRPQLESLGHRFRTNCDTEVILHLYEEYGFDCLNYLNGQFAIAIWNSRDRSLFLARDRLGIRPLFYTVWNGQLILGSEIKALLSHPNVSAQIDPTSLAQVFTFWSVLAPQTIFKDIHTLPPAHYMLVRDGDIKIQPYWELDFTTEESPRTPQDYLDEFEHLLIDSTLIRLRADVPVGAYLSGGLDSSTTTAIIRKYAPNKLDTFSIAFSDPEFDESAYQQEMASLLGTEHRVIYCQHQDISCVFPEVIWHTEIPTLRTAPAPMFMLSGLVRDSHLKVVLTGEGADEFLGGYDIFKEMVIRRFWAKQPDSQIRPLLLRRLYPEISRLGRSNAFLTAFFKQNLTDTDSLFYSHRLRWSNTGRLQRLLLCKPEIPISQWAEELIPLPNKFKSWSFLAQAQYLEIATFMSPYLLSSQGDRVAMANSVEGRFPFLDYRVVEFCDRLPSHLKLRGLTEKWLLRQLARKLLPADIGQRRKRPYRAPIHRSFFYPNAPDYISELLSEDALRVSGLFNPLAVNQLVRKAQGGAQLSEVDDMAIAGVLSSQLVYQQFVKDFKSRLSTLTPSDRVKVVEIR